MQKNTQTQIFLKLSTYGVTSGGQLQKQLMYLPNPGNTQLKKHSSTATQHGSLLGIAEAKKPFFSFTIISYLPVATPGFILKINSSI